MTLSAIIICVTVLIGGIQSQQIGADTESTNRIITSLCKLENQNDRIAKQFFACYDGVMGQSMIFKCQKKLFGCLLNTGAAITGVCSSGGGVRNPVLPKYLGCLLNEFQSAGIDFMPIYLQINICQGRVFGL